MICLIRFGFAVLVCCCFGLVEADELGSRSQDDRDGVLAAYRAGVRTNADFKRVSKFVTNSENAQWRRIPWIPSLWEGVKASQAKNKPMFIWAMNGEPLGCV